jgi:hypothetical protein
LHVSVDELLNYTDKSSDAKEVLPNKRNLILQISLVVLAVIEIITIILLIISYSSETPMETSVSITNDNIKEIDNFFKLMDACGIKTIAIDIEVQYARKLNNKNISNHIYLLVDYFEQLAAKLNIKMLTYSFLSYVLKDRKIKKSPLVKNKFVYGLYVRKHNDKSKNLIYRR